MRARAWCSKCLTAQSCAAMLVYTVCRWASGGQTLHAAEEHWGTLLRLSARCTCRDDALAVAMLQVLQRLASSRDSGLPSGFAGHLTEHILLPCLVWRSGRGAAVIRALCMQVDLP